jgi:hypothetical protein
MTIWKFDNFGTNIIHHAKIKSGLASCFNLIVLPSGKLSTIPIQLDALNCIVTAQP